jgi:sulfofructose kinase
LPRAQAWDGSGILISTPAPPPSDPAVPRATTRPAVVCVGHATLDAIVAVPRLPSRDERLPATDGVLAGGGPAATAAVALARLGVPVAFAGRIGDDQAGAIVRDGLAREGVDVSLLATVPGMTPFTAALVGPHGDRVLLPTAGSLPPIEMTPGLHAALAHAGWLHVDHVGAALLPTVRTAAPDVRLSIDGGNPIPDLSLAGVDLYAPTVTALLAFTGAASVETGIEAALAAGTQLVVATDGAGGAYGARNEAGPVQVVKAPARPIPGLVSTLGAGDAFHGGLLAALLDDLPLERALAMANAVAAASTRALDGRSALPDRAELDRMLERIPVA